MKPPVEEGVLERTLAPRTGRLQPLLRPLRRASAGAEAIPEAEGNDAAIRRDTLYRRTLALADLLSAAAALLVLELAYGPVEWTAFALLPLIVLVSKTIGLYDRDEHVLRKTTLDEAPRLFQVTTLYAFLAWLMGSDFIAGGLERGEALALWGTLFVSMIALRATARRVIQTVASPERCLVVGDRGSALWLKRKFEDSHSVSGSIVGQVTLKGRSRGDDELPVLGDLDGIGVVLSKHDIDRVIIAPGRFSHDSDEILHAIRLVKALGVKATVLPRLFEVVGSTVEFDDIDGVTLLGLRRHGLTQSSRALKRTMDIVGSLGCILLLAPLLVAIACAIKLTSHGPVLFRQRRIGRRDREFQIYKFRTMIDGAEVQKEALRELNECEGGLFKIEDDPRVTRVGRLLRRSSLDELPQLFNVLRGDMSLVGPRPLVPDEDAQVEGLHRRRLVVKPGMTGLWQIFGSSRIPLHEMVKIDYLYGANWSVWLDVKVLLRTLPYVLARRGC